MEKITSIFMIFGEIDIDSISSISFVSDNICSGHNVLEMKITCTDYTDFYTCIKGIYFVFLLLMFKRLFYLVGINIAILITINILIVIAQRVFGIVIEPSSYTGLIIFGIVFGFGGAIVNLLISRWSAKRLYKIQLFDESIGSEKLKVVYRTVQEIAYNHKITIPEVGVYEAAEVNAFAT